MKFKPLLFTLFISFSSICYSQSKQEIKQEQNPFDEVKAKVIEAQLIFTNWFFLQYQTIQTQAVTGKPISPTSAYNKDLQSYGKIIEKDIPELNAAIKSTSWDIFNEDEKNFLLETSTLTNTLFSIENEAISIIGEMNSVNDFEVLGSIHFALHAGKIDSLFKQTIKNYSYLSSTYKQRQFEKISKEKDEKHQQSVIRNMAFVAIAFFVVLLVFVIVNNRKRRLSNIKLQEQKELITHQKKEIIDSINYANNIQKSILPTPQQITDTIDNCFVLFMPRDIVSGDFYFFYRNPYSKEKIIACCDCTGHGVPGAFMSFIGYTTLNKIVTERKICNPAEILESANRELTSILKQNTLGGRDGMDVSLLSIDGDTMNYAGANRPAWIVRNNEIIEFKPTKNSIGGFQPDENRKFEKQSFKLQKNDFVYLFTDGFADQFGGPEGKKLMSKKFKERLLFICGLPIHEQQNNLKKFIIDWQGTQAQVDDILVIGIRV